MRKLLGNASVDSGLIYIGDPCYISGRKPEADYKEILEQLGDSVSASLIFKLGHEGAGVVSSTLHGDGTYPVYGYFKDENPRPYKLEICFDEEGET